MSYKGWFDGELRSDAWFDAELQKAGWFDTELIDTSSAPSVATLISAWDGATWLVGTLKRWNGAAWVDATLQRWNGTSWEVV